MERIIFFCWLNTGIIIDKFNSEKDTGLVTVCRDKSFKVDKKRNQKNIRDPEVYILFYYKKNSQINVLTFNYVIYILHCAGSNENTQVSECDVDTK
jgi:hypothetical protein